MSTTHSPGSRLRAPRGRLGSRPQNARAELLSAARLGGEVARADLAGRPGDAAPAYASWRRLRRYADRDTRALIRMAFDTGYGQAVQAAGVHPPSRIDAA